VTAILRQQATSARSEAPLLRQQATSARSVAEKRAADEEALP
jgi:hypothetical protein